MLGSGQPLHPYVNYFRGVESIEALYDESWRIPTLEQILVLFSYIRRIVGSRQDGTIRRGGNLLQGYLQD